MRVEGERSFSASRETVWDVLNDPAKMAELMPGVESFDVQDDRHWSANVKIPLGLGGLRMSMKFDKVEERAPEYAKLDAKGTGVGAMLSMQTAFNLAEADGGGTTMKWEADVSIAGPVGAMGQRVLQPIVNQQVSNVLNALEKQVTAAEAPGETPPAAEPSEGAGGAEEGISPLSPETYTEDPEGPTTSTEDPR
jgi:carbon monoxide dehydrogenase subunit G